MEIKNFFIATMTSLCLAGCASSDVSRNANNEMQTAYQGAGGMFGGAESTSWPESFANSSQTTKGALIGGATGAVAGGITSGVGVVPGAAGGAIFGGALGAYIDSKTTLEDRIENRGGKAVVLGDQVLIVLPSRKIFNDGSAQLSPYAYSTLNLVAQLINRYPNMTVKVAAYVNSAIGSVVTNQALTQEQANNVERYLWRAGVKTRMLYAAGYGGAQPIVRPTLDEGEDNNRLEITLEKLPV